MKRLFFSKITGVTASLTVILLTLFLIIPTQAQPTNQWCLYSDEDMGSNGCAPIDEDFTQETCEGLAEHRILDYDCSAYNLICCCLDGAQIKTYGPICDEKDGRTEGLQENCADACFPVYYAFELVATVYFPTDPAIMPHSDSLANGDYTLLGPGGQEIKSGKFFDGNLLIELNEGSYSLKIEATRVVGEDTEKCQLTESNIKVEENKDLGNLFLDCEISDSGDSDDTDPECVPDWVTVWENQPLQCGKLISVHDNNECGENYPIQEGEIIDCPTLPDPIMCGNGVLNEGQQCEILDEGTYLFPDGFGDCTDYTNNFGEYFTAGNLRCTSQCIVDTSQCIICPNTEEGCTSSLYCVECPICQGAPVCQDTCTVDDDLPLSLSRVFQNQIGIRLDWSGLRELCDGGNIEILRCIDSSEEFDGCTPSVSLTNPSPANLGSYFDTDFEENHYGKNACYKIKLSLLANGEVIELESITVCERIPHQECLNKGDENFCEDTTTIGQCVQGLLTSESCEGDKRCVNPSHQESARCVDVDFCDRCSGPFGLFSYTHWIDSECTTQNLLNNNCFREDYSIKQTLKGKFNSCAYVTSCYDYRTWHSCEEDLCDFDFECEWNPFTEQDELGIGICRPSNEEEQNCNACDYNPAFGGFCSRDLCMLYGDCYYNTDPKGEFIVDNYFCNNKHEVGCETFNTEQECEGGQELDINVIYDLFAAGYQRIDGSHEITNPSNDALNLGKCVWTGQECVRDASFRKSHTSNILSLTSDCNSPLSKQSFRCLTNFDEPETTIYVAGEPLETDQTYSTRQFRELMQVLVSYNPSTTYFSLSKDEGIYPSRQYVPFINQIINELGEDDGGEYYLNYYSITRPSNNLEIVKSKKINLLTTLPITISHQISSSYVPYADMVLSNVSFTIESTIQEFTCTAKLVDQSMEVIDETILTKITTNGELFWNYYFLEDGLYNFQVTCWDIYDQLTEENYNVELNEDITLSNPTPRMETFKPGTINLRIESISGADCSYKSIFPHEVNIEGVFTQTGGTTHTTSINVQDEGVYIIKPTCVFDEDEEGNYPQGVGDDGVFEGNHGDNFIFGIDNTAPTIVLYDLDTIEQYDNTTVKSSLDLRFECYHSLENLIYGFIDLSSPCEETLNAELVLKDPFSGDEESSDSFTFSSGQTSSFTAPETFLLTYLKITSLDELGNEELQEFFLNLRDLTYQMPEIIICDPLQEDC